MGQTLTHGIYLPDEGERNCYDGLAGNWQLLDGAVGTVAEHTTALAGKAPLVHTHTKADITDFPVYGTTAGTICEGNDSRLSDARTPVAHTHGKADITNLFNSANTWSEENTYTSILLTLKHTALEVGVLPASNQTKRYHFTDKNNASLGWLQHRVNTSGDSYLELYSVNKFSNGQLSPQGSDVANSLIIGMHSDGKRYAQVMSDFYPAYSNLNCNLGTSTNKWKTLNGINPGALSLPNLSDPDPIYTGNWVTSTPTNNTYTPSENGWLNVVVVDSLSANEFSLYVKSTNFFASAVHKLGDIDDNNGKVGLFIPVIAGITYYVVVKGNVPNATISATFYPCLGNV